jgi:hypothetical protein
MPEIYFQATKKLLCPGNKSIKRRRREEIWQSAVQNAATESTQTFVSA